MKAQILIDEKRGRRLLDGKVVTVRVPANATSLQIRLQERQEANSSKRILDVFFNWRPA